MMAIDQPNIMLLYTVAGAILLHYFVQMARGKSHGDDGGGDDNAIGRNNRKKLIPYTNFGHTHKTLLDKIFGLIFPIVFPMHQVVKHSCNIDKHRNETDGKEGEEQVGGGSNERSGQLRNVLNSLRKNSIDSEKTEHNRRLATLNKLIQEHTNAEDHLIGGTVLIPRNHGILSKWKISNNHTEFNNEEGTTDENNDHNDMVEVELTCAASMITSKLAITEPSAEYHAFQTCSFDEIRFSSDAEIIIHFHGGGMILGAPRDMCSAEYLKELMIKQHDIVREKEEASSSSSTKKKSTRAKCQNSKKLVLLSVNYRFAPEHPFPSQIVDALSVMSSVVEHLPAAKLHLLGMSAGASLALIACFESIRYYGNKINLTR